MSLFLRIFNVKRIFSLTILCVAGVWCCAAAAENLPQTDISDLTAQKIYAIAQDRNGRTMQTIRDRLDITDENGNTALCLAQQNQDKESMKMLLVFGASDEVDCYDEDDPICAIIAGEKLKINGAGWLALGTAAAAGAVYGISELIDDDSCPSGYSKRYRDVSACGIHPEGWIYEAHPKHKKCGKCTPKTYDTGCTTLWQSVNDCGEHPEGWNFESSGYAGDEVCGICTPKQCVNRDSTTVRGENIRYTDIEYCPHRDYMVPISSEQKGWAGVHGCYICNYACDEKTGFAAMNSCVNNADGHAAYDCLRDADTQCYYRDKAKTCPTVNTTTTRGSSVSYAEKANCPVRKYLEVTDVTPGAWSGDGQCYTCNYACDEKYGFANETTCKTNKSGGEGYVCQLDPNTQCYYRSRTPNPETPDGGEDDCPEGYSTAYQSQSNCAVLGGIPEGWTWSQSGWSGELKCGKCEAKTCSVGSTAYKTIADCPAVTNKIAVAVQAVENNYAGAEPCNECIYWCDPAQRAFATQEACQANASGLQCVEADGCWVIKDECPDGYHTWIQNCNDKAHPDGWNLDENGKSNGLNCNKCVPIPCSPANVTDVSTCGPSGENGWKLEFTGYSGDNECKTCKAKECPNTEKEGGCSAGAYETETAVQSGNYAGNTPCYTCSYTCYNSYDSQAACEAAASSTQYCKEVIDNISCWRPVEYACPAGYTAGLKPEDCDTYKGGYEEQTILVPDPAGSKGLDGSGNVADCYTCGFDCKGTHDGWPLVTGKNEEGYIYIEIWSGCYLKQLPGNGSYGQCVDQNGQINTAYPESYITEEGCPKIQQAPETSNDSWLQVKLEGYFYAGEQCYLCASNPCSVQEEGTDTQCNQRGFVRGAEVAVTSGTTACYTCDCDTENGYYDKAESVPDCAGSVSSLSNYNGKQCYFCASATRMLSSAWERVNNQTLIIRHEEGDYYGDVTINAKASAPVVDEETGEVIGGDAVGSIHCCITRVPNAEVALPIRGIARAVLTRG